VRKEISIVSLFVFVTLCASGQEVKVKGKFLLDSIRIGEQIPFTLSATYPKNADVVFPDSTFSFAPFEFQKKKFFPTTTKDSLSYDSVVYYLSTYEIDSLQSLKLPVFAIHESDCTSFYTSVDTLRLVEMVAAVPDTVKAEALPLKTNTKYQNVKWLLNYPIILIIGGVLIVALVIVWAVFGKRIKKYFALKRLQKNHQAFLDRFNSVAEQLKSDVASPKAEEALVIWKRYMENLEAKPFTKFTSKEIIEAEHNETLGFALRAIDRFIYGGTKDVALESISTLRDYTDQQYQKIAEEVKNG
jgi:hypothetical protein